MRSMQTRRSILKKTTAAIGLTVAGGQSSRAAEDQPARDAQPGEVSAYPFERNIWVRVDGRTLTCYRAGAHQKLPYFYPLLSPATGLPMTEEAAHPYPHHRSLYLGCDHVNGANFWQQGLDRGQIASRGPARAAAEADAITDPDATGGLEVTDAGPGRVVIRDVCDWALPGQPPVIEDRRTFTIAAPTPTVRLIDADITLIARTDVRVTKTNHSLFALRAAHDLTPAAGGTLFNDQGAEGEKATFGQKARWCGYHATRHGHPETLILMDHPANPWSPCQWFTRDYGFVSPTPFNWLDDNGWSLPNGQSITLRYRVLITTDTPDPDHIAPWYRH